ncbi:filamentous hemagglutinin N-terminal domain-containing protein [Iningainema tapete]|uniref:Filamentous hemagglutinin N-terminal domain-containing protein n=1 Tax=Iningainema tapete BLCC-T55 TaxID=2748662 RepID=A0A8J7CBZ1_9CYAN|nr:filamentous hemagglutinin N-terminal domain-containing protein [Iningainema tapete]MBD2778921.1 filamentous hemagglutinin N-terminal domain-containing protein [Iningainema tapete BLCC-T55]
MSGITQNWRCWCSRFVELGSWLVVGSMLIASLQERVFAQITPDATLPNNSSVTRDGNIFNITGGTQAGSNLFHSFSEFSVRAGETAFFNNAADIQNIISRVTGGSASNIDGIIRALGTANLFLINPNGIIFGRNAQLNIGGSFVATTASSIGFGERGFFSATNPNTPELLTVNPNALLFNQMRAASIKNNSIADAGLDPSSTYRTTGLRVPNGQSLLLVGGDIYMDGGGLYAFGGRVELAGASGAGTVGLNGNDSNLSLSFPDNLVRADVSITNLGGVSVRAGDGGSIVINSHNLNMDGGSLLLAGIESGLGSISSIAGDIEINATGLIKLTNNSYIQNGVGPGSVGKGGNIKIATGSFALTNGASLNNRTFGQGDAGNIIINARDTISLDGVGSRGFPTEVASMVLSRGVGKGGNVNITANSLSVTNGAALNASTFGRGDGGSVNINAREAVSFDRDSYAFSAVELGANGNSGGINITTKSLSVTNGAQLLAYTGGNGNAGNVTINARDNVSFDRVGSKGLFSAVYSTVDPRAVGKGGDITITTGSLFMTNDAELVASTKGQGDAGSVTINARDTVSFDRGKVFSAVETAEAVGKGANVKITTGSLFVTNGAQLLAYTRGQGDAGDVIVDARNTVSLQGVRDDGFSSLITTGTNSQLGEGGKITISTADFSIADGAIVDALTFSSKPGGSVTINANTFSATKGGQVTTSTYSNGLAGNINLNITDSVTLSGSDPTYADRLARFPERVNNVGAESGLFANANFETAGKGGDISVNTRTLSVQDTARIAVNSQGTAVGGNIQIQANNLTLKNQALISAETFSNQGGNIEIGLKDILLLRQNSRISTNAGTQGAGGDGGNITINAPNGFIVAVPNENSDITANAYTGSGGRVQIKASGVYGIGFRDLENSQTSDITASSEFGADGTVELITPEVDPNSGLVELPTIPVDTEVASGCYTPSYAQSSFVITGRGGLPPNPKDVLTPDTAQIDWVSVKPSNNNRSLPPVTTKPTTTIPKRIVEATGATLNAKGQIVLTANSSTVTPQTSKQNPTQCHGS